MTLTWPNILPLVVCPWTCHISQDIPANAGIFVLCGCRAQWQGERGTCIRQYLGKWTQGLRNACQDDWAPGVDTNQTPTEHKTRDQTTRLWSPLSCCAAHTCSAVQISWIRRNDDLMSDVSHSLLYTSRQSHRLPDWIRWTQLPPHLYTRRLEENRCGNRRPHFLKPWHIVAWTLGDGQSAKTVKSWKWNYSQLN